MSLALTAALCASGCVEPLQNGGVNIIGDPSDRLGTLCRFRHGDASSNVFCGSEAPSLPPARVRRVAEGEGPVKGSHASARAGDFVLENDEIAIVVEQLGGGQGIAESGGNIVDALDAKRRADALGQIITSLGSPSRQAIYETIQPGQGEAGAAFIDVAGHDKRDPRIRVRTRYTLTPGARAVAITTELTNSGPAEVAGLDLGDTVLWGGATNSIAGKDTTARGDATAPYLFAVGEDVAYALATDGQPFFSKNGAAWSSPAYVRGAALAPGASLTYERLLIVAPRGDSAAVATELFYLSGGAPGAVEIALAGGATFFRAGENRIALRKAPVAGAAEAFPAPHSLWLSAQAGAPFAAELSPGSYTAKLEGTAGTSAEVAFEVTSGKATKLSLKVNPGGLLRASVLEVEPGIMDSAKVEWAKGTARASGLIKGKYLPAKLQLWDAVTGAKAHPSVAVTTESAELPLPAGKYRIVASRGPEFTIDETTIEIVAGQETRLELGLVRAVDTRGYIGCDLHMHTSRSLDTALTPRARLAASAAEGVECAVETEHNAVFDPAPVVAALGLGAHLRAFPGQEIVSDSSGSPFGHLAVFPVAPEASAARGGALKVNDRSAREVIEELRAPPGERIVQVNHPRGGAHGFFDQLRFNAQSGAGDDPGYDGRFDTLEVWSGPKPSEADRMLGDLWTLLRTSHPVTPTASAFVHGAADSEPGYPRTYVAVSDDDPAKLDVAELVSGLKKRRDVLLSNGPFVTLRLGEARQGGLASLGGKRRAELTVRVERAPWVDASELSLYVGGTLAASVPLTGAKKTERGAWLDEVTFPLVLGKAPAPAKHPGSSVQSPITLSEDSFAVAVVRGARPLSPVLSGDPADLQPFAMTAPLWIDADGDGRALGR